MNKFAYEPQHDRPGHFAPAVADDHRKMSEVVTTAAGGRERMARPVDDGRRAGTITIRSGSTEQTGD